MGRRYLLPVLPAGLAATAAQLRVVSTPANSAIVSAAVALGWRARRGSPHTILKASRDSICNRRRCPSRASGADVPWHGLLYDGPSARPPRHALYGQWLEAPTRTKRGARTDDHWRSRRRT